MIGFSKKSSFIIVKDCLTNIKLFGLKYRSFNSKDDN